MDRRLSWVLAVGLTCVLPASFAAPAVGPTESATPAPTTVSVPESFRPAQQFQELDTNHDGRIDEQEAQRDPKLAGAFGKADTSRDGGVDAAEFAQFEPSVVPGSERMSMNDSPALRNRR